MYTCIASLLTGVSSEGLDSDPVEDGILSDPVEDGIVYVGRTMLTRVQKQLKRNEEITEEVMSKLLGFLPDEDIMTPVDVHGVDANFVSIDTWLDDLGPRGTAKALVKAAKYYMESKREGTETQAPQFVGTLMLEQTRDKLAMDEEVTDEDVSKMLGFLPDERSFVALDLSQHGHDFSDAEAWLSQLGLKGAAEACVAAAPADFFETSIVSEEEVVEEEQGVEEAEEEETVEEEQVVEEEKEDEEAAAEEEQVLEASDSAEVIVVAGSDLPSAEENFSSAENVTQVEHVEEEHYFYFYATEERVEASEAAEFNVPVGYNFPSEEAAAPPPRARWCALNRGCEQFQGMCCPDSRGRMAPCCAMALQSPPPDPITEPAAPQYDEEVVYVPRIFGSWR